MARRMTTTLTVGATALVLVSCLSGAVASASVATKPMSEKQWRKTVNNICTQSATLLRDAGAVAFAGVPKDGQPSLAKMTAFVTAIEPTIQQQIDSIKALKEPVKLKAKVKALLKTAQGELDAVVADPSRGLEGNPFTASDLASKKLKLKACAS